MIKVRLYTDEEWIQTRSAGNETVIPKAFDSKNFFDWMLSNGLGCGVEYEKPPFRDAESIRLLKSFDIVFVSDEDWYSILWEGSRMSISSISSIRSDLIFALAVIGQSRAGDYTWYQWADQRIWKILADLPFDALIAARIAVDINTGRRFIWNMNYQIMNYPYRGQGIEVAVRKDLSKGDFYARVLGERKNTPGEYLYTGKDGKYYAEPLEINYAFQYFWKNDISGIIAYIDRKYTVRECKFADDRMEYFNSLKNDRTYLADVRRTYNIFELGRVLEQNDNAIMNLPYLECQHDLMWAYQEGKIEESKYKEELMRIREEESYKEYLYFRDTFKIVTHLPEMPKKVTFRKLPMLMVDKNNDGTYYVHGSLTVKYPEFDELLYDVISERSRDRERFVLIVDVEELLDSPRDIDRAVCGFRVMADSVEVYDKCDAIWLFGIALKEAYGSDTCKVDDAFY